MALGVSLTKDTSVGTEPLIPESHAAQIMHVDRVVCQEPLADALKLLASPKWVGVQPAQKSLSADMDNETRGRD